MADAATHWRRINSREGGCPTHEEIGFALAAALGVDGALIDQADRAVDELAGALIAVREVDDPATQLIEVGNVLSEFLLCTEDDHWCGDLSDLLAPQALVNGIGAEVAVVSAALAACMRAGLPFGAVASEQHLYLVHHGLIDPYVLAPRFGWRFVEATDLHEGDIVHLCPHELAKLALGQIAERTELIARPDLKLAVSALRVDVPSDSRARHADQQALAMARARFN